jgi:hypothetical protein
VLPIGCVAKAGPNVLFCQIREVVEDFFMAHAGSKIAEYIVDCNAHPANAWPPAAFTRLYGNDLTIVHDDGSFGSL